MSELEMGRLVLVVVGMVAGCRLWVVDVECLCANEAIESGSLK
jgi:hypothetical protein